MGSQSHGQAIPAGQVAGARQGLTGGQTIGTAKFNLIPPEQLHSFAWSGRLNDALNAIADLVDAKVAVLDPQEETDATVSISQGRELVIQYQGQTAGRIACSASANPKAADAMLAMMEHAVDREVAVEDLAGQLLTDYEELNMLYHLLPDIATKASEGEIGTTLVEQAAERLRCGRVSMLVLNEDHKNFRVLASIGLPAYARDLLIPVSTSIAGQALSDENGCLVDDMLQRTDLAQLSQGSYDTSMFALIRVPLKARGQPVGVLAATERLDGSEFTARDVKLLEGLSAMGASALMHCRLHSVVKQQMLSTIGALACAVDAKDSYTHAHSSRVAKVSVATARCMGIEDTEFLRKVELAGLLHDIGKIGIPDSVLSKIDRLTTEEFALITQHADIGAGIVEKVNGLEDVATAIRHHHERYDGLGYPKGLAGDDIPLISKLISVADAFDSLTSDRPYRKGIPAELALTELDKGRDSQFDRAVLEAFKGTISSDRVFV